MKKDRMERRKIFIRDQPIRITGGNTRGDFVQLEGEKYYRISDYDRMPDFFMSIVSASDQWMFISSNGSLTAGRKNAQGALFPYYPEDKIHDYHGTTGGTTVILADHNGKLSLWEPFSKGCPPFYSIRRNLYKNQLGNKLIFEEINQELSLSFTVVWLNSDRYGFVRKSKLSNTGQGTMEIEILDGLQNILPSGVDPAMQSGFSCLVDAYKKSELDPETGLGIFRLSSIPVDTAEPSESLKANIVWSEGFENPEILLSGKQVDLFKSGVPVVTEQEIKAEKGAYLLHAQFELSPGSGREWNIVADVNQDAADVAGLMRLIREGGNIRQDLHDDIERSSQELRRIVASADALQSTRDELSNSRHLTNVLFNVMRGGVFEDHYHIRVSDFLSFVESTNKGLVRLAGQLVGSSGDRILCRELLRLANSEGDPDLKRVCYEYLPLTFSRRHGDPSRPWNRFSIENRNEDGSRNLDYQGNWRDIFQNWEATSLSFPEYVEGMICRFVNASTADGYNPYRITRNGIDWEVPDPSDPWSNIGYWGDHQIIYLLKLLEISNRHHPGTLHHLLKQDIFCYANVPYRIKSYGDLLNDPRNTIEFDLPLEQEILERVGAVGSDGKLVWGKEGRIVHVNLAEKLLVPLLAKLSHFIPGAGIWMNTQRPEWNDANNALVGFGLSMVTTYHLRAYVNFCRKLFSKLEADAVQVSEEVAGLMKRIHRTLLGLVEHPGHSMEAVGMKLSKDALGQAGSDYRMALYKKGLSGRKALVRKERILEFFETTLACLDATIAASRRNDKLFHSYNLIRLETPERMEVRRLYEMLEGQVAVLDSGFLPAVETVELLDALKASALFREDQHSYILYPDRRLPSFLEKNNIPAAGMERSRLLKLLADGKNRQIIIRDVNGICHFNGNFRNASMLKSALGALPAEFSELAALETPVILEIYEEMFDHQSFTGRSGTFFGYEGLGSIYWHMVSKLLLAACNACYRAYWQQEERSILKRLTGHYYDIKAGLGLNKDPRTYGAFPTDPYSHTPGHRGAQQPGMTGQVKEDIIARWGELGVVVREGSLHFIPILLRASEFHQETAEFQWFDLGGKHQSITLEPGTLAFTYCQVPVIYRRSRDRKIILSFSDGGNQHIAGDTIDGNQSAAVFRKDGKISRIEVWLEADL
jgi:hypothetical protein